MIRAVLVASSLLLTYCSEQVPGPRTDNEWVIGKTYDDFFDYCHRFDDVRDIIDTNRSDGLQASQLMLVVKKHLGKCVVGTRAVFTIVRNLGNERVTNIDGEINATLVEAKIGDQPVFTFTRLPVISKNP